MYHSGIISKAAKQTLEMAGPIATGLQQGFFQLLIAGSPGD